MAGYVCAVAGGKGGAGKTTTALNVGGALQEAGYDAVVVDADLGMANLGSVLDIEHEHSIHDVLAEEASVSETLIDAPGGLTVVPGDQSLTAFAAADPDRLEGVVETLRNAYDVVLLDTGAGLSREVVVPLELADGILLVTTPDDVAVGDTVKTARLADRIDGAVVGAVINRVTKYTDVEAIADRLGHELLAVVPDAGSTIGDEPIVRTGPDTPVASAFRQLAESLAELFFRGVPAEEHAVVVEKAWFVDEQRADDEQKDAGGVFGLFD